MQRTSRLAWLAALPMLLCQCGTLKFYSQAVQGHLESRSGARPINALLADPRTPEPLRKRLELVQEIRGYAETRLQLPAARQYHRYKDIGREHLVWVVFAAPEFSLEPHTWRYLLLGRLEYRGWFSEEDAGRSAEALRARGLDVYIAEIDAYSTLGWFSDPVLNTFIDLPARNLAELLFHELTHQRLYFPGDTAFNEALATAVGRHAARLWLADTGRAGELALLQKEQLLMRKFLDELDTARSRLERLYQSRDLDESNRRAAKKRLFDELALRLHQFNTRHGGTLKIQQWLDKPLNNARLNSIDTYHRLVPLFDQLIEKQCGGDLERLFAMLKECRSLSPAKRVEWLLRQAAAGDAPPS